MRRFNLNEKDQNKLVKMNDEYLAKLAKSGINQQAFDEVHKSLLKAEAYGGNEMSWGLFNSFDEHKHNEVANAQASAKDAEPQD